MSLIHFGMNHEYDVPAADKMAAGIYMLRKIAIILSASLLVFGANAQTPVEKVIIKYEDVSGARNFIAQGLKMTLARKLLKSTPVAPIASEVDELAVLKMENAAQKERLDFVADLDNALKSYEYYGKQLTKNGEVDIYILRRGPDSAEELVIYNSGIFSLNSLHGDFTIEELLELDGKGL